MHRFRANTASLKTAQRTYVGDQIKAGMGVWECQVKETQWPIWLSHTKRTVEETITSVEEDRDKPGRCW